MAKPTDHPDEALVARIAEEVASYGADTVAAALEQVVRESAVCAVCGKSLVAERRSRVYCGPACRMRAYRARRAARSSS